MNDEFVLSLLRANGPMTVRQIVMAYGLVTTNSNLGKVRRQMRSMSRYGLVKVVGEIRDGTYHPSHLWEVVE